MRQRCVLLAVISVGCQVSPVESSTEQATVIMPAGVDFGMQLIREASTEHRVAISPGAGNQVDTVTGVSARCPDFSINAPDLPVRVTRVYEFGAIFKPTIPGRVSCVVTVTLENSTSRTITLTGTGMSPPIAADVEPPAVTFGEVRSDTDSTVATVGVHSSGSQPLDVKSVSASSGFTIVSGPTTAYALPSNATQDYKLACHPIAIGDMTGVFTVESSDPMQDRIAVELSCKGVDSALGIVPSPATLQTTRVGEPVATTIELRNTGTAPMTLEDVRVVGTDMSLVSGMRFPMTLTRPTDVARVDVRFDASAPGDASATLIATYDRGKKRSTQITGRALPTSFSVSPDGDVDFGPVCIGQRRTRDFVLMANDQGGFRLASISDPGAPFSVASPTLPMPVAGGGATQVVFHVTAAPEVAGLATATTAVHTDIPHGADRIISLGVLGLPPGVTATPDSLDLGSLQINTTGIGKDVQLSNCSASPIGYSNARIEGPDASDFAIVSAPSAAMIAPNGLVSWLIVLQAHSVGPKRATFSVDHDGGTRSVDLIGEGLADPRGSYYACSSGRPAAPWPIALALLALRRRSRATRSRSR